MRSVLLSVAPLFAGLILLTFGLGLLGTLLGVRMADAAFTALGAGFVMTGYFAGQLIGSLFVQRWIETVGHIRTYAAFTAILSAATLVHPFALDAWLWAALRLIQGFCMAGLLLCVESWLIGRATPETRGKILALYMIAFYGAYGVGQFLLNIPDVSRFGLFIVSSILISLAAVPIALTRVETPELGTPSNLGVRQLYDISPTGIVTSFMSGIILGAFYGLTSFYATGLGLEVSQTAGLITAAVFGGLIMQWPIGQFSDRFDRRKVIVVVAAALGISAAAIVVFGTRHYGALLVLIAAFGGFSFTLYPLSVANANDHVGPADIVATGRSLLIAYSSGSILGPLGAAFVMLATTPQGLFMFIAAVAFLSMLFVLVRMRTAAGVPAEEQMPFHVLPRTTPEVMELDPRAGSAPDAD